MSGVLSFGCQIAWQQGRRNNLTKYITSFMAIRIGILVCMKTYKWVKKIDDIFKLNAAIDCMRISRMVHESA